MSHPQNTADPHRDQSPRDTPAQPVFRHGLGSLFRLASLALLCTSLGQLPARADDKQADDAPAATAPQADAKAETAEATETEASGDEQTSAAEQTGADEARPLSVAPLDHAEYPEDRPAWIDRTPDLEADVVVWPVSSLPQPDPKTARESLQLQIRGAVAAYNEHVLGADRLQELSLPPTFEFDLEVLDEADRYAGTVQLGDDTVYEAAARLTFDSAYRQRLVQHWREFRVQQRLRRLGVAGGVGLCLLLAGTGLTRRIAAKQAT